MKKTSSSVILTLTLVPILTSCHSNEQQQVKAHPVKVHSQVVNYSLNKTEHTYVGVVEEQEAISMAFNASGTICKVHVTEGQRVKRGQAIAEIDDIQAKNMLETAQAQMHQAQDAYDRLQQLHSNNSLPEMEWVEVQSRVRQAQATLEMAKKALQDCIIYAPQDGIVGKDILSVGEVVLPALPVAKILVTENVTVRASIPEKEISAINASTPTLITLGALPGMQFKGGKVEKCIEPNSTTRTYDIKINVGNAGLHLLPGMVATVQVDNLSTDSVLTVPITSVRQDSDGGYFVWTAHNGQAHMTKVVPGTTSGDRIEISSGLVQDDVVITEGYHKLSEGMEVVL